MGLMLAEPGFHTRCFVEWEEYPRKSIIAAQKAGYFQPAPIWDDVTTFDGRPFKGAIDTVLAGYPCQPFSQAGQRKGEDDERHLWPEIARIIREIDPGWVFLENVAGHATLGAETVLRELHDMGFTSAVGLFSAEEVGATHERLRWFCAAHAGRSERRPQQSGGDVVNGKDARRDQAPSGIAKPSDQLVNTPGLNGETRKLQIRRQPQQPGFELSKRELADTSSAGQQGSKQLGSLEQRDGTQAHGSASEFRGVSLFPPAPNDFESWQQIIPFHQNLAPSLSVGDVKSACNYYATMVESGKLAEKEAESHVRWMAHELSNRPRILRLLGNAVVPLQAAYAWRTLAAAHGLKPVEFGER